MRLFFLGLILAGFVGACSAPKTPTALDYVDLRLDAERASRAKNYREAIPKYFASVDALDEPHPAVRSALRAQAAAHIARALIHLQIPDELRLDEIPSKERPGAIERVLESLDDGTLLPQTHPFLPDVYEAVAVEFEVSEAHKPALEVLTRAQTRWPTLPALAAHIELVRSAIRQTTREPR